MLQKTFNLHQFAQHCAKIWEMCSGQSALKLETDFKLNKDHRDNLKKRNS